MECHAEACMIHGDLAVRSRRPDGETAVCDIRNHEHRLGCSSRAFCDFARINLSSSLPASRLEDTTDTLVKRV